MPRWIIAVNWECEVEAETDLEALLEAQRQFVFMDEADAEELDEPE